MANSVRFVLSSRSNALHPALSLPEARSSSTSTSMAFITTAPCHSSSLSWLPASNYIQHAVWPYIPEVGLQRHDPLPRRRTRPTYVKRCS
ncbi:hypothetical protein PM082_023186 [Marasmius tenuissimus]|nr:hypothetical protein PM082_023186 [Marasmius tenuissimus]